MVAKVDLKSRNHPEDGSEEDQEDNKKQDSKKTRRYMD